MRWNLTGYYSFLFTVVPNEDRNYQLIIEISISYTYDITILNWREIMFENAKNIK